MNERALTEAEQAVVERELGWGKGWAVVRVAPGRKLVLMVTPQDESCKIGRAHV